jgi:hypothetical protein
MTMNPKPHRPMNFNLTIVAVLFFLSSGRVLAQHALEQFDFKAGERMLKDGDLNGAYPLFSAAAKGDPTNAKYAKKKAEVGATLCSLALQQAKSISVQDPVLAYEFVRKALSFDSSDGQAREEAQVLQRGADVARAALKEAHSAARHGDGARASALLDSASAFRC